MALSLEQQVLFARQIFFPALKEMKRSVAQQTNIKMTDGELLAVGTFACCQLAVETDGTGAFERVRSLVDDLERAVLEEHAKKNR